MRAKILTLGLICFFVFAYCKKNLPTSPDLNISLTINHFTANPTEILFGEYSTLSWDVRNASKVEIDQGIGNVLWSGTVEVNPTETTIYTLTAYAKDGSGSKYRTAQVTVDWSLAAIEIVGEPELFIACSDIAYNTLEFRLIVRNVADKQVGISSLALTIYGENSETLLSHLWQAGHASWLPQDIPPGEERIVSNVGYPLVFGWDRERCEEMARIGRAEFKFTAVFY